MKKLLCYFVPVVFIALYIGNEVERQKEETARQEAAARQQTARQEKERQEVAAHQEAARQEAAARQRRKKLICQNVPLCKGKLDVVYGQLQKDWGRFNSMTNLDDRSMMFSRMANNLSSGFSRSLEECELPHDVTEELVDLNREIQEFKSYKNEFADLVRCQKKTEDDGAEALISLGAAIGASLFGIDDAANELVDHALKKGTSAVISDSAGERGGKRLDDRIISTKKMIDGKWKDLNMVMNQYK